MLRLIGLVVSIGLADSLNPTTVGPALYLAAGNRPRQSVIRFTVAVFVVNLLGGLVLTLGPGEAILSLVPRPGATARYILETAAGVAMIIASAVLWKRHDSLGHRDHVESAPSRRGSPAVLGATIAAVEFPTAFPYFAAIVAIVGSGLSVPRQISLLLIYNACFVLPLVAMIIVLTVAGERADRLLLHVRDFFRAHWPVLLSVVALAAGIFTTVLGVTGLLSGGQGAVGRVSRRVRRVIPH